MDITSILATRRYNFTARTDPGKTVGGKKIRREIHFSHKTEDASGYVLFFSDATVSYNVQKGNKRTKVFFIPHTPSRMNKISWLLFECDYNEHTAPTWIGKKRISSFG